MQTQKKGLERPYTGPQWQFGLLGGSLGHSFSPRYFGRKFAHWGLPFTYEALEFDDVAQIRDTLSARPHLGGLNVTFPFKQSIIPYLDGLDRGAEAVGAVNTIAIAPERQQWIGQNTDVLGFEWGLRHLLERAGRYDCPPALVLGTGGASLAAMYVLKHVVKQEQVKQVSRTPQEGMISYEDITPPMLQHYRLVVNCTPLGMYPNEDSKPALPYDALTSLHLFYDMVYNPQETAFMKAGRAKGAATINGYKMLVGQAEASWRIWCKQLGLPKEVWAVS